MAETKVAIAELQGNVLGYASSTSTFATTNGTDTQVTSMTASVTIPTLNTNQRIEIEYFCRDAFETGGGILDITIYDGTPGSGTILQTAEPNMPSGNAIIGFVKGSFNNTDLTAGAHTINIGLKKVGGTQANVEAAAAYRMWMQVKVV